MSSTHRLTATILRPSSLLVGLLLVAAPFVTARPAAAQGSTVSSSTLEVTISADKTGTVDRDTGEVSVSGTLVCSRPARAFVTAIATQTRGSEQAAGGFGQDVDCSPTPVTWRTTITPNTGDQFRPGPADLTVAAYSYDYEQATTVSDTESRVVKLKRS